MSGGALLLDALRETDPGRKCELVAALRVPAAIAVPADWSGVPGRPPRPHLVPPREVPVRRLGTPEGRAALLHAIAHIEFNAINLALDAALRFAGLPAEYYADWISVAQDEARHFTLLRDRLRQLGHDYGDFEAHNGLWEAAEKTRGDVLERMALVPRVLEARGLDVTPGMIRRFRETGDDASVAILELILAEEVRHVAIGTRWFLHLCHERGIEPQATFLALLRRFGASVKPPLNTEARRRAGFAPEELAALVGHAENKSAGAG